MWFESVNADVKELPAIVSCALAGANLTGVLPPVMFSALPDLAIVFMGSNPGEPVGYCLLKGYRLGLLSIQVQRYHICGCETSTHMLWTSAAHVPVLCMSTVCV